MATEKPVTKPENAHFLKGHASWLYCDSCHKTVAYVCYTTHSYFRFAFTCACGATGWAENQYPAADVPDFQNLPTGIPARNAANKRFCCAQDGSALFSPVPKNLKSYTADIVCRACHTWYTVAEIFP